MTNILAILGIGWIIISAIRFVAEIIATAKTRADKYKAINEFCKEQNYCRFGCGGGYGHDNTSYYGGWGCQSDHK